MLIKIDIENYIYQSRYQREGKEKERHTERENPANSEHSMVLPTQGVMNQVVEVT